MPKKTLNRTCMKLALFGMLSLPVCPIYSQTLLPETVQKALQTADIPPSSFAALVIPISGTQEKLSYRANMPMIPASTMKLITTYVALEELKPTFRWKTQILSDKVPQHRQLTAPLYINGGGAPDLSWERLGAMFRTLYNQGVHQLNGDIVLDRTYFQPSRLDINAPPFDDTPDAYYNVIPDALLVHSNLSSMAIDSEQKKMQVSYSPPMAAIRIRNKMTLSDASCIEWEKDWVSPEVKISRRSHIDIILKGTFPRNCKITTELNMVDRNLYIENLIRKLWSEMGGKWHGHVIDGVTPSSAHVLVEKLSDTLADNIKLINKRSDNAMARLLFLTLGTEDKQKAPGMTTSQAATARIHRWLKLHGMNDDGLLLENGSGLSRVERVTATQLSSILQSASNSTWFPEFLASLPIAGVDGTMRKRLIGTAAEARARVKTGTLSNAVAVAGFVKDQDEKAWIVIGMVNHDDAIKARPVLDALINWVATTSAH